MSLGLISAKNDFTSLTSELFILIVIFGFIIFIFLIVNQQKSLKKKLKYFKEKRENRGQDSKKTMIATDNMITSGNLVQYIKKVDQDLIIGTSNNFNKSGNRNLYSSLSNDSIKSDLVSSSDFTNILLKQKNLYDINILTFTEFVAFKKEYISSIIGKNILESKEDFLLGISTLVLEGILSAEELSEIKSIISKNLI